MPNSMKRERGFSLPEVLISVVLLILSVVALTGLQNGLVKSTHQLSQYRQLWRHAWNAAGDVPYSLPDGWQLRRVETSRQRCVSISVIIVAPSGRQGHLTRLRCPQR